MLIIVLNTAVLCSAVHTHLHAIVTYKHHTKYNELEFWFCFRHNFRLVILKNTRFSLYHRLLFCQIIHLFQSYNIFDVVLAYSNHTFFSNPIFICLLLYILFIIHKYKRAHLASVTTSDNTPRLL